MALDLSVSFAQSSYAVALGSLVTFLPVSIAGLGTRGAAIVAYLGRRRILYVWFTTYQQTRYLVPVLSLLMIPSAYAFWQMTGYRWTRWVATTVLTLTFLLFIGYNVIFNAQFVRVVFGGESRHDFLANKVSFYDDIRWVNQNLPEDSLLLFYHQKSYYLEQEFLRSDAIIWEVGGVPTADDLLDLLQERGITHVFVPDRDDAIYNRLLDQLVTVGALEVIYTNPEGVQVVSRTLSQSRLREVKVLEVSTPHFPDQPCRACRKQEPRHPIWADIRAQWLS